MPTTEEVSAVLAGIRLIDAGGGREGSGSVGIGGLSKATSRSSLATAATDVSDLSDGASLLDCELDLTLSGSFDVEVLEESPVDNAASPPSPSSPHHGVEFTMSAKAAPQALPSTADEANSHRELVKVGLLTEFLRPLSWRRHPRVDSEAEDSSSPRIAKSIADRNLAMRGSDTNECVDDGLASLDGRVSSRGQPPCPERRESVFDFLRPRRRLETPGSCDGGESHDPLQDDGRTHTSCSDSDPAETGENDCGPSLRKGTSILQSIADDFSPQKGGDHKILRAIGRTVAVNAAVLLTAATGGAAGAVGYIAGGAITSRRLIDGLAADDDKEVTKSLAVYGAATSASLAGQAITGALLIGLAGASLPVAGAVAFGVGCVSGVTAGAVSEWTVDRCYRGGDERKKEDEGEKGGGDDAVGGGDVGRESAATRETPLAPARRWLAEKRMCR